MKQEKEFDRSICFTFYKDFHEQIMDVKRDFGIEQAFEVYEAIANYGLYGTEIEKGKLRTLTGNLTFSKIDGSQENRARWFNGENFEQTRLVAEYMRDHSKASQRTIAAATGVGKTKVGNVQKSIRESGLSIQEYLNDIVYPNLNHNSNYNNSDSNNYNNNATETETDQRDQSVYDSGSQKQSAPPKDNNLFITPDGDATKEKIKTYDDFSPEQSLYIFNEIRCADDYGKFEKYAEKYNTSPEVIKRIYDVEELNIPFVC